MTTKMYSLQKQSWRRKFNTSASRLLENIHKSDSNTNRLQPFEIDENTNRILRRKKEEDIISESKMAGSSFIIM